MSLMTYEEARPWAKAIRDEVASRRMPPWGAVSGVGDFVGDPSLSTPEIDMLIAWIEGGAPEGDPVYLPHRVPDSLARSSAIPQHARELTVTHATLLQNSATLVGLRPEGASEAWAVLPDHSVRRLIWMRDYRKEWARTFVLREPEKFPAGTQIHADGTGVVLLLR